jgi:hypothetical protein
VAKFHQSSGYRPGAERDRAAREVERLDAALAALNAHMRNVQERGAGCHRRGGQGSRLKNGIASILPESNFEIVLKEFVVHRKDLFPPREFDDAKIQQRMCNFQ